MKERDQYLKFVQWEEHDGLYVGYFPDLFPWGGVCHAAEEQEGYKQLCGLVGDEVEQLRRIPGNCPSLALGLCATRARIDDLLSESKRVSGRSPGSFILVLVALEVSLVARPYQPRVHRLRTFLPSAQAVRRDLDTGERGSLRLRPTSSLFLQ